MNLCRSNTMKETELDKIKRERKSFKAQVEIKEAVLRLYKNKDYALVIDKLFMLEDCARYAKLSGSFTQDDEVRSDSLAKSQAAGHLQEYLNAKIMLGSNAENSLAALDELEQELLSE